MSEAVVIHDTLVLTIFTVCILKAKDIEYVNEYTYLGQNISFTEPFPMKQVERRIKKAWSAYWAYKHIFKSKIPS